MKLAVAWSIEALIESKMKGWDLLNRNTKIRYKPWKRIQKLSKAELMNLKNYNKWSLTRAKKESLNFSLLCHKKETKLENLSSRVNKNNTKWTISEKPLKILKIRSHIWLRETRAKSKQAPKCWKWKFRTTNKNWNSSKTLTNNWRKDSNKKQ